MVKVVRVDLQRQRLDFRLVLDEPQSPRRKGRRS
jgi:hypothetical protein